VRETPFGPVAFERMSIAETEARARRRLRDAQRERELAASEIGPLTLPAPPPDAPRLGAGEIAARRAGSRNRATGILLHRVLELWDGASDVDALLRQLAVEAAADDDAIARVRRRLGTIARSPTWLRIARAETVGRELPLRFVENGALVERRVDRLIRENGREIVIDYKSGAAEEARVARDREQVARYCAAIRALTGRDCSGMLWYIDVEQDRVVEVP
jgi:ATP-dependent exoDNAse (exonuclease V) beta subunit